MEKKKLNAQVWRLELKVKELTKKIDKNQQEWVQAVENISQQHIQLSESKLLWKSCKFFFKEYVTMVKTQYALEAKIHGSLRLWHM